MNERIKLLALQVYGTQATEQEIKFAELIVRECMSKLYLNGYDDAMIQLQKDFGLGE